VVEKPEVDSSPVFVLLVEDEESDRLAIRLQLEVMGLKVTDTASNCHSVV